MNFQKIKLYFLFLLFSCVLFSCEEAENEPVLVVEDNFNVNAQELVNLVNTYRAEGCKCGNQQMPAVSTITWNTVLAKAAYLHSKDMNDKNYFSHTGKDGSNAGQRITRQQYNWKTYGENIAKGYPNEKAVIDGWIDSEGHCKNIMNPNFKEMGIGRENDYWTQVFGAE